jgi:hypothetical protein
MTITHRLLPITLLAAATCMSSAWAGDINQLGNLSQSQFYDLSKDLAAATSSNPMEPAAPLGLAGFDVSVATTMTNTQAGAAWDQAAGGSMSHPLQAKLMATKGLPWGVDLGGFISQMPNSNVTASGFHVKYALLEGSAVSPAVAVRTSYSRMGGVSQMGLNNTGLDLLVSKGFVGITPYAGIGTVHSTAKVNGVSSLHNETLVQGKSFVGVSLNMMLVNLTAEYTRVGSTSNVGVKAGLRF